MAQRRGGAKARAATVTRGRLRRLYRRGDAGKGFEGRIRVYQVEKEQGDALAGREHSALKDKASRNVACWGSCDQLREAGPGSTGGTKAGRLRRGPLLLALSTGLCSPATGSPRTDKIAYTWEVQRKAVLSREENHSFVLEKRILAPGQSSSRARQAQTRFWLRAS